MDKKINWPFVMRSYFFWVFLLMAILFSFGYILDMVIEDDPEAIAKREWCEEYHPNKPAGECAKIAGW